MTNNEKYNIICEKCGKERDITKQVNSELDFQRKELIEEFENMINKYLYDENDDYESLDKIDVYNKIKIRLDKLKEIKEKQ